MSLSINVEALFTDKKGRYAVYVGQHENKAVLSGATEMFHTETDIFGDVTLKVGDRVYFDEHGAVVKTEAKKPVKIPSAGRSTGSMAIGKPVISDTHL